MIEITWALAYLILGGFVGFFAGLLGIGGGGIMVPILTTMFVMQGFGGVGGEHVVHMALSTSMASIILTSVSSLRAHHKHGAVLWPVVRTITPGILLGTFGATFIASMASSQALAIFFVCFMSYVAIQMLMNVKPKPHRELPGPLGMSLAGLGIGGISALVAIGGATVSVPFMTWCNVRIQNAIATASAIGFPIAVSGTIGYFISGLSAEGMPAGSIGYIYLPAVVLISAVSYFTAPIGAGLAHRLPVATLKKVFAGLIVFLCVRMLLSIFG
ncbi:sulfite exporter TauE/SafE family protein [Granulosicoccaceae sp. 1_MG-2023]|nr:sulfite exporter TauE/SafE family protein [Granulosicoccaceae sp. 1_MG-2023]